MSRFPATPESGRPFVMKSTSRGLLGSTAFVAVLVVQFPVTSIMAAAVLERGFRGLVERGQPDDRGVGFCRRPSDAHASE
jgi:hypothetical protein